MLLPRGMSASVHGTTIVRFFDGMRSRRVGVSSCPPEEQPLNHADLENTLYIDAPLRASACGAVARRSAEGAVAGAMFWFTRNRFAGSYFALTRVSRS